MKKFYVTSQFTRDEENSIEVLVRKSHTAECPGDEWSTLVVFDYKDAAKVLSLLKEAGIPVTYVSDVTGFPEIMDGRVKTLNPKIHGAILAVRSNPEHMKALAEHDITPIDLVVVNLYPFRETVAKPGVTEAEAIENIDIGGPAMVRASAKNFKDVVIVTYPSRYAGLMEMLAKEGDVDARTRKELALEAFTHTAEYDAMISEYLKKQLEK